jgi:histidine triad (HIT) family protein
MSSKTIFQKIVDREIPASIVYEDDMVIAILDIHPVNPGHTLVIPKQAIDEFQDLDDKSYLHTMSVAKKIAKSIKDTMRPARVGLVVAGFDIPHVHVHVIPLNKHEDIPSAQPKEVTPDIELQKTAEKIRSEL